MSVFSSSPSFYFSSRFFAFLFVKAQKIPSDRRWPTHYPPFRFPRNRRGGAFPFPSREKEAFVGLGAQ